MRSTRRRSTSGSDVKTPLECLVLLDKQGLVEFKKGNTPHALQARAKVQTDLQAAQAMQQDKAALFATFNAKDRAKTARKRPRVMGQD